MPVRVADQHRAKEQERRPVDAAGVVDRLLERAQQFVHREAVVAAGAVAVLGAADRGADHPLLAVQLVAADRVGEAGLQHRVEPRLEDRWRRVPVQRELQHEAVVLEQQRLLGQHVDRLVGVERGEIAHGHMRLTAQRGDPGPVDARVLEARVGDDGEGLHATVVSAWNQG
jgi:hypothetical protein